MIDIKVLKMKSRSSVLLSFLLIVMFFCIPVTYYLQDNESILKPTDQIGSDIIEIEIKRTEINPGSNGLKGLWHFNEGSGNEAKDATVNGNDGTFTNMDESDWVEGKYGNALEFDGGGKYITVANPVHFDFEQSDAFSVETWIKTSDDWDNYIIGRRSSAGTKWRGYCMAIFTGGKITVHLNHNHLNDEKIWVTGNTNTADGQWHHVGFTYNGNGHASGVKIYVDGNLETMSVSNDNLGGKTIRNSIPLKIGARGDGQAQSSFVGIIDEVAVWSRELSLEEVVVHASEDNVDPVADAGPDLMINIGGLVKLDGTGSTDNVGIANYSWSFIDDHARTLYGASPTYVFNNYGTFVITLTVTDEKGNSNSDILKISVSSPIISWTGEKGFIGDGIHPEEGLVGESYNFRISYKDESTGLEPDFIQLVLDVPGEGETEIDLDPLSNHDDYSHGVIHAVFMNLTKAGTYRYYFKAGYGDGLGTVRMPTSEDVYMSDLLVNTAPRVYGGINRDYGVETTNFRYNATFWDADNDPADPKNSFIFIDGVHHPMIETNVYDLDTVNGKGYYYEQSGLTEGVHDFYFYFKDSFGTITKTATSFHPIIYEGWPDLKIASSDISFSKDPETENLVIEANIHNIGKGSANNIPVTFWSDDPDTREVHFEPLQDMNDNYTYVIPYLAKGRSHFIEWVTWLTYEKIPKGSYYVIVDLDYTGDNPYSPLAKAKPVEEGILEVIDYSTDNTNNKARNIFLNGPNVELRKSEVSPQSMIYSSTGKDVTFRVKVRNVGNKEVPFDRDIDIRFSLTSPDGKDEINVGSYSIRGGMAAGSYEYAQENYRISGPEGEMVGKWILKIEAEVTGGGPGDQFSEADTGNNVVYVDFNVIKIQSTTLAPSFSPSLISVVSGLLVLAFTITWLQKRKKVH